MKKNGIKMPQEIQERFERISKEVEVILTQTFPAKIKTLLELEKDPRFDASRIESIYRNENCKENQDSVSEPSAKKRPHTQPHDKDPLQAVQKAFEAVCEMNSILKPELRALLYLCLKLQIWIELMLPKIEDGNNFGVGVQEALLEDLGRVQQEMGVYLEQFGRYHLSRAKVVAKYMKNPTVEDFAFCIKEIDEKEMLNLRVICMELANYYHGLLDMIVKNYQKIVCPRSSNHESMY